MLSRGHLDRIYTSKEISDTALNWRMDKPGMDTDHDLVSVQIMNPETPFIGKGRWARPVFLAKDKKCKQKAIELLIKLQEDLENLKERTNAHNPQWILRKYKEIVAHEVRSRQKCAMSMRQTLADDAKEEQTKIYNDPTSMKSPGN